MNMRALIPGIISVVFGIVLLLIVDGPRAWYTGIFFLVIGIVMLFRSKKRKES